ncbi:hypothetical protein S40288_04395 [Stachybotrys chartarum IBT 40288]|nr:hypothetical protein S40288_04395 [Stachybotrys chartarum IBT 40288]
MEPSSKKRKLAPKVAVSSAPNPQPAQNPPEPPKQPHLPHDAPAVERHDFESFARHLQDAAMLIQRQTERSPYTNVSVLLLRWEDDQSVEDDLVALDQILRKEYNFETQQWQIPTVHNPSIKLGVQMASFLEQARHNHLLIIYYAGYGYVGSDGHLYWACNAREDAAKLKWDGVRCLFEDAQSDILLLLDTCSIPDPPVAGSHGVKQVIAACNPDYDLRQRPARSFTANLIEVLYKLSHRRPFSIRRLYEEVASYSQQQQLSPHASNGTSVPEKPQTPLFITLTPGQGQGLTLAPLPARPQQSPSQNGGDPEPHIARDENIVDPESVADLRFDDARILVCTTFVGDASPDMSSFNQWLQNTPPLGATITVEGMFLGPPTMLLISMPHSIWSVVQHDKVCCFLGYITSRNMIHIYQKLVGPGGVKPSARQVEDGRILLEARESARVRRGHSAEVEDSAEMQEAAEQLKALSHVRHRSDETPAVLGRQRTTLPDSMPDVTPHDGDDSMVSLDYKLSPNARLKAARRALPRQETRCNHCSHAPFKDSSSLRKHIAAAHTRPFPCAFSFAGCNSTFGSKNEWKRHIASQHLCLTYYRCSMCSHRDAEGRGNEFNRKDLFTQHLRRMHAPPQIKRAITKGDSRLQTEWDNQVKQLQQSCLVSRRLPPQKSACPNESCQSIFEGPSAWDEWTEHVGRHMEKGEGQTLGVDSLLAQWALDEGIIEPAGNGYRLCAANGLVGGSINVVPFNHTHSELSALAAEASPEEEVAAVSKPMDRDQTMEDLDPKRELQEAKELTPTLGPQEVEHIEQVQQQEQEISQEQRKEEQLEGPLQAELEAVA